MNIYNLDEIYKLEKSNEIIMKFLNEYIEKYLKVGITTKEIDEIGESFIRQHGATPSFKGYYGFPSSLCISVNEEVVHGIPKKSKKLKEGDVVGIDVGTCLDGYYGDGARTFIIG